MLLNADVKSLEVYTAAYLSQDKVMMDELISGVDMHERNQQTFKLPSRLIAKILGFRILYGGSAYSFVNDSDFMAVSKSEKYWANVIDMYYEKYSGLNQWHDKIVEQAMRTKKLVMPTGRVFKFEPTLTARGDLKWPITNIKNYPVQGTGSDLVAIARVSMFNRMLKSKLRSKMLATVHDSILFDCPDDEVATVAKMIHQVAEDVPQNFKRLFGCEYNLPFLVEVEVGSNYADMEKATC